MHYLARRQAKSVPSVRAQDAVARRRTDTSLWRTKPHSVVALHSTDALGSPIMAGTLDRELVHKINNLIAVIYTQVAVGKSAGTFEEALRSMEIIERAAKETEKVVAQTRETAAGGE